MGNNLNSIKNMEYPGRLIIIGKSLKNHNVVVYAITGRSPSSQARKLEVNETNDQILVKPTDEETLKKGNPDLLIYPAIIIKDGIIVSNGKHTKDINLNFKPNLGSSEILAKAAKNWEYEPDEPTFTPRISGCITKDASLNIIKRSINGTCMKNIFEIPLIPGKGMMIATYTGINQNPLPSFEGEPKIVDLSYNDATGTAKAIYKALGPDANKNDFRVTVAAVFQKNSDIDYHIINRNN
jgi:IMP cyclohydrolase